MHCGSFIEMYKCLFPRPTRLDFPIVYAHVMQILPIDKHSKIQRQVIKGTQCCNIDLLYNR